MNKRILVDTSIWVEYFNRPESEYAQRLAEFLEMEAVCVIGIILAELLQGAKTDAEFELLRKNLKVLPLLKESEKTWEKVGKLSFELQRKGTVIPLTDCLIAVLAQENNCQVFTLDNHFTYVPQLEII
ncbi:MAG: PIN domain-containing protein [Firmicutes bacterium]|jgi:predicted nucleic acid-binding protein|nr:PIN domain-containing protein [Bacillota bacterium]